MSTKSKGALCTFFFIEDENTEFEYTIIFAIGHSLSGSLGKNHHDIAMWRSPKKCVFYMFLSFIVFCIHAKFSNRQTDNIIVELHIKIRKKDIILVGKAKQKNIFCAYPDVTHQLFLALILISNMSRGKRLPHIATKAIKTTSKAATFVLVAAPLPRFLKRHKAC